MIFTPDYPQARPLPSPNHGERLRTISTLILHYTGVPTLQDALDLLLSPRAQVSAHYLVAEDGSVLQLVPESRRAWHAGKGYWAGETDLNSTSIGVEIQHPGHADPRPYPQAQIRSVVALARNVCARNGIAKRQVLAHSDIAIARKVDPGEFFPWDALAEAGVGLFVPPAPIDGDWALSLGATGAAVASLRERLAAFGYDVEAKGAYDERLATAVSAFQRHFRPALVDGRADASTLATLTLLLRATGGSA